jgi:transcriptional regulatory protein RtcR
VQLCALAFPTNGLDQYAERAGRRVTFSKEARELFLDYALSSSAIWLGNFRDLNAAIVRMATLAPGGRISVGLVGEEIERLRSAWAKLEASDVEDSLADLLGKDRLEDLDLFDRVQLARVIHICRDSRSLSDAGRKLFSVSRGRKAITNDADRLRKYLNRFGIEWVQIASD